MTSIIERSGLLGNFVFNKQTNFLNRIGGEGERSGAGEEEGRRTKKLSDLARAQEREREREEG